MSSRRKRYRQRSKVWPWISFVVFSMVLMLLGYSIYKKESPAAVIKSLFKSDLPADDPRRLNKKELMVLLTTKDQQIAKLEEELNACILDDGFKKATISTTASTLNMRDDASLSGEVIVKIPNGSKVSILYFDERELLLDGAMGQWCKVKYAGKEGWVWGNYLSTE